MTAVDSRAPCIWVDADARPVPIKQILFKAAERTGIDLTLVANHVMPLPRSKYVHFVQVPAGFDVADHEIVKRVRSGDLVVTQDIPLAAEVIEEGAWVLNTRGERLDRDAHDGDGAGPIRCARSVPSSTLPTRPSSASASSSAFTASW